MEYDYDLIIVGGGPAGSIMALAAGRRGLSALLLDRARFPRDKVCGDLVPLNALPILRDYGLSETVSATPHTLATSLVVHAGDERLRVPGPPGGLLVCRRFDFDNVLFQAASSAVDTREEHHVTGVRTTPSGQVCGVRGETSAGRSFAYSAKVVAGADGFKSIIARATGVYNRQPEHWGVATRAYYRGIPTSGRDVEIYYFNAGRPDYLWIFPVDETTVNVGVGRVLGRRAPRPSLRALHEQLLRSPPHAPRFASAVQLTPIQGWNLPLASKRRVMHGPGFILAGDAAGLIDPMWGHGINTAMIAGQIAGELLPGICRGDDYGAEALAGYADAVWSRLGPGFADALDCRRECVELDERLVWDPLNPMRERCFGGRGELGPTRAVTGRHGLLRGRTR